VVYEVRKNEIGVFISEAKKLKGSTGKGIRQGMVLSLPKIPFKTLLQIISLFRDVCDMMNGDEALIQIYWDKVNKEYIPVCPTQTTTNTNVTFLADKDKALSDNMVYVMDIHSHNTMGAFFSGTDDSSEKANRLYGVFGKINQNVPEYKFRTCNNGTYISLDIFDIFEAPKMTISFGDFTQEVEMSEENLVFPAVEYPSEWFEIIKKGKEERDKIRKEAGKHRTYHNTKVSYGGSSGKSYGKKVTPSVYSHGNQQTLFDYTDDDFYLGGSDYGKKTSAIKSIAKGYEEDEEAYDGIDEVEDLVERIGDLSMFEFKMLIDLLYEQGLTEQIVDTLKKDYRERF
jgi:PRTRC genetic system protein A